MTIAMNNTNGAQGVQCPECGCGITDVKDSRPTGTGIRRRRKCQACGNRFTTYEVIAKELPDIESIDAMKIAARDLFVSLNVTLRKGQTLGKFMGLVRHQSNLQQAEAVAEKDADE